MTDAVKLLTEAELHYLLLRSPADIAADFRMRGFMAKEPEPDPLDAEADRLIELYPDSEEAFWLVKAALKRGMEMRPPLTREMVKRAVQQTISSIPGGGYSYNLDELHAALTKEQS